jgi:surface antigen
MQIQFWHWPKKELPIVTFNKYRKLREWGKVDFDKYYWAQCVDLIRDWVGYAQLPPITNFGNANGLATIGLWDGWRFVKSSPFSKPKIWDIIFWNYQPHGHVAVVGRSWLTWVEVLEQNFPWDSKKLWLKSWDWRGANAITLRRKSYRNIIWWYTPNDNK